MNVPRSLPGLLACALGLGACQDPSHAPRKLAQAPRALAGPTYYVAVDGDDAGPGSFGRPFRTINTCAAALSAAGGGACRVRAGTYPETVRVTSNTLIQAYGEGGFPEEVVVTGADTLAGLAWTPHAGNVWKAAVDLDAGASRLAGPEVQIFVDGLPQVEARWPNIGSFENLLDLEGGGYRTAAAGSAMADGLHGTLNDPGLPGGLDLTGAVVHVLGGLKWCAHTGTITSAAAGSLAYTVDNGAPGAPGLIDAALRPEAGSRYFLTQALSLLDAGNEFFYDSAGKILYLTSVDSPANHAISAKMREWAFDLSGAQHARLSHLKIVAASILMDMSSASNVLSNLGVTYLSHYVRNQYGPWGGWWNNTGIHLWGEGHTLIDSTLRFSAGNGVSLQGNGHRVIRNAISFTDYAGVYNSPLFISSDVNGYTGFHQILGNTLGATGRDGILHLTTDGSLLDTRIAYNDISDFGRLAVDLGGIYLCCDTDGTRWVNGQKTTRTSIDHNRVHDGSVGTTAGIMFDNRVHGFVTAHNVLWNNHGAGLILNGYDGGHSYDHTINNNTFWSGQTFSLAAGGQNAGGLSDSFISNNIFVTEPMVRTGCAGGICSGGTVWGEGGASNYYGNPGFTNGTVYPYDFHLYNGASNPCSFTATPIWTDTYLTNSLCPDGISCASPVAPSFGAYNTGGYDWAIGIIPRQADGAICGAGGECASGNCTDGFCCDLPCAGACEACDIDGAIGTCGAVTGAPHGLRAACGGDGSACSGTCDGQDRMACIYPLPETSCGGASCADSTLTLAPACDGVGHCVLGASVDCAPYRCEGTACLPSCTSSDDCLAPAVCEGAECKSGGLKPDGEACQQGGECQSGNCVDGFCCGGTCAGQCEACDIAGAEGICNLVTGAPHGGRPACDGAACEGLLLTGPGSCDGAGACAPGPQTNCTPYLCEGTTCKTACTSYEDCLVGYRCVGDACVREQDSAGSGCGCGSAAGGQFFWLGLALLVFLPWAARRRARYFVSTNDPALRH